MQNNDYISRDYAVENMENFPFDTEHDKNAAIHLVRELVSAANLRPVVRSRWIEIDDYVLCANCGVAEHGPHRNYCHNCGADMRPEGR